MEKNLKILKTKEQLLNFVADLKSKSKIDSINLIESSAKENKTKSAKLAQIAIVPTMGALHLGHKSLIDRAVNECEFVIVSIFVNPTQFAPNEDLAKYPRTLQADLDLCEKAGAAAVFAPQSEKEIYPFSADFSINFAPPKALSEVLEGAARPSHFGGVLAVVLKLFALSGAERAYFGEKDTQQLLIIKQAVRDLFLKIKIIPCPIVRDENGLALSSRNSYLSQNGKKIALRLNVALCEIKKQILSGELDCKNLYSLGEKIIKNGAPLIESSGANGENSEKIELEYLSFCDRNLQKIEKIELQNSLILLCARVEGVRLLDNLWI